MTTYCWAARMGGNYGICDNTCAAYKNHECVFLTNLNKFTENIALSRIGNYDQ